MDLKVFLKMDGSGFQQGLTSAHQAVGRFAQSGLGALKGQLAAAFSVGAIVAFSKKTIDFAGNLRDISDNLGVNVEWLQKMNYSAGQAGASMEDLGKFIRETNIAREAAMKDPSGKEAMAFGRLGMSSSDISGLSPQAFVDKLAKTFAGGATVQMQNDIREVGGRTAHRLVAAFMNGMDESFRPMTDDTIDALDTAGDAFFRLKIELMTEFAPALVTLAQTVTQVARDIVNAANAAQAMDWKRIAIASLGPMGPQALLSGIQNAWAKTSPERAANEAEWDKRDAGANWAARQRAASRRQRENSAPLFDSLSKQPKSSVGAAPSDSLISVGNFLGRNRSVVEAIGQETNRLLREHSGYFKELISVSKSRSGGIEVPP